MPDWKMEPGLALWVTCRTGVWFVVIVNVIPRHSSAWHRVSSDLLEESPGVSWDVPGDG